MKKPEAQRSFTALLDQPMADHGFQLRKSDCAYLRKNEDITCFFGVDVYAKTGWFSVVPTAFVGSARINRIYAAIVGQPFSSHVPTCGFSVRNVSEHRRGHYSVEHKHEISAVSVAILRDYEDFARPFHERYASIAGIDDYLNTPKEGVCPAGSVSWACLGLIAAHLVGRQDVRALSQSYYAFWSKSQNPKIAGVILRTSDYLCGALAVRKIDEKTA